LVEEQVQNAENCYYGHKHDEVGEIYVTVVGIVDGDLMGHKKGGGGRRSGGYGGGGFGEVGEQAGRQQKCGRGIT
jgi:hypothetical protein